MEIVGTSSAAVATNEAWMVAQEGEVPGRNTTVQESFDEALMGLASDEGLEKSNR